VERLVQWLVRLEELEELVTEDGAVRLVVLQPTPYCGLDCAYCYLPGRDDRRRMAPATLDAIGRNLLSSPLAASEIDVVWHAGEPTTLPPRWYEEAFARLAAAAPGRVLRHGFQTNAIHVDAAWVAFWKAHDVRVGVSIDGPAAIHDARRRTRAGGGSHAMAMRGVAALRESGWPFHVNAVLTADALSEPDAVLDFFAGLGAVEVGFNVEEREGAHGRSSLEAAGMEALYRRLLARAIERADPGLRVREVEGVRWLVGAPPAERVYNPQVAPLAIVSVSADGRMSTYSPELLGTASPGWSDFAFADVHADGPEAILANPVFRRLRAEVEAGVAACARVCGHFGVCGGGAPSNKYFEHGHFAGTETLYCRLARKATLDATLTAWEAGHGCG
jgi:uncharacterized protein